MFSRDEMIRSAAFAYVDRSTAHGQDPISWAALNNFTFDGVRVPLVSQQGIFKPAVLQLPISIRTTYRPAGAERPYEDEYEADGYLLYKYRGTNPNNYDNVWLRRMREAGVALLYFEGVAKGLYMASGAVIVEDYPEALTFGVRLFDIDVSAVGLATPTALDTAERRHYLATVRRRAGQVVFRETVLAAYGNRCSLCRLGHRVLLDAAHIIPDSDGGPSVVPNGIAMCKIHHAAFDSNIVGIRPDHVAEVRADVLEEVDGPMLRHGLQELHGARVSVPRSPSNRPARDALERRYERFRGYSG